MRHIRLFVVLASLILLCRHGYAEPQPAELFKAITRVRASVPETAYTARSLGTEREGNGVVIDTTGHVLTIGYLILEAETIDIVGADNEVVRATFVGYDHHSGFGLVRTTRHSLSSQCRWGHRQASPSATRFSSPAMAARRRCKGCVVVARQEFAGYWEYLLEDAIFTTPPYPHFGGAALIDRTGRLVGIGSLLTPVELPTEGERTRQYVRAHRPSQTDSGRSDCQRSLSPSPQSPGSGCTPKKRTAACLCGALRETCPAAPRPVLPPGDIILKVGQQEVQGLADFYRQVWALGAAGCPSPGVFSMGRASATSLSILPIAINTSKCPRDK